MAAFRRFGPDRQRSILLDHGAGQRPDHSGNDGMEVSAEEIKAFAAEHVGERAARPVHVTLMDELPKTAVGKVFKPELRQEAITRVLTEAIAVIEPSDGISEEQIGDVLDKFAVGWRMQSAS